MRTRTLHLLASLILITALPVVSRAGCTDSVHVSVDAVQCHGLRNGVIEIKEIFGGVSPYFFSLDGQSYSTRPVFDLLWAGNYVLHVRDSTGCVQRYPVTVPEPEELTVALTVNDTMPAAGQWIQLKATVEPPGTVLNSVSWRPPAQFASQYQLNQSVRILEDTDFSVEVRNANGCVARDELSVKLRKTSLYFPNVFSPGTSQNSHFTLFAGEGVARIVLLQVFDRSGTLIFERRNFPPSDPLQGWNGKWNGRMASPGVYPWVGEVEFQDGKRQQFTGSVTLVVE